MEDQIAAVKQDQQEYREKHTQKQLEQAEYLQNENVSLQKELTKVVQQKRVIFNEIDKENMDYQFKTMDKVNEKDTLRLQICEIEHILRKLRLEIEETTTDSKRIQIVTEKEDELVMNKQGEEKRIVKLVNDDLKEQIRSLEEQFNIAQATQVKQEEIEKRLKSHYEKASKDLDHALSEALKAKAS